MHSKPRRNMAATRSPRSLMTPRSSMFSNGTAARASCSGACCTELLVIRNLPSMLTLQPESILGLRSRRTVLRFLGALTHAVEGFSYVLCELAVGQDSQVAEVELFRIGRLSFFLQHRCETVHRFRMVVLPVQGFAETTFGGGVVLLPEVVHPDFHIFICLMRIPRHHFDDTRSGVWSNDAAFVLLRITRRRRDVGTIVAAGTVAGCTRFSRVWR